MDILAVSILQFFIYNSNKYNYWVDQDISASNSYYGGYLYSGPLIKAGYTAVIASQSTISQTVKPERITFIPPNSNYYRSQFYLSTGPLCTLNPSKAQTKYIEGKKRTKSNLYYEEKFDFKNSPLNFRNFLAFMFSEDSKDFFFIDNEFYVNSVKFMKQKTFTGKIMNEETEKGVNTYPFFKNTSFYIKIAPDLE